MPVSKRDKNKSAGRFAYEGLDRLIHERARLAILSSLAAHEQGVTFNDLKELCALTDGNLSRQLQMLREADFVDRENSALRAEQTNDDLFAELCGQ